MSEVNILREVQDQYIVKYHDRIINKKKQQIMIVMEYCEGGDLSNLIAKAKSAR